MINYWICANSKLLKFDENVADKFFVALIGLQMTPEVKKFLPMLWIS